MNVVDTYIDLVANVLHFDNFNISIWPQDVLYRKVLVLYIIKSYCDCQQFKKVP